MTISCIIKSAAFTFSSISLCIFSSAPAEVPSQLCSIPLLVRWVTSPHVQLCSRLSCQMNCWNSGRESCKIHRTMQSTDADLHVYVSGFLPAHTITLPTVSHVYWANLRSLPTEFFEHDGSLSMLATLFYSAIS